MTDTPLTPAERRAYEAIILPLAGWLRERAVSLADDETEADDLVQDTLLRAYRGWHTYRHHSPRGTRAWLKTILLNTFRNRLKAVQSRRRRECMARSEGVTNMATIPDTDAGSEAADLAGAVRRAVKALPTTYAVVVTLVDLEGASYIDAAAVLGIAPGSVASRLHRARTRLAETLPEGLLAEAA
jgi:RNA polymerase sigma-70 factor (ECF subfamily)